MGFMDIIPETSSKVLTSETTFSNYILIHTQNPPKFMVRKVIILEK